ncbi:xylosyl- and glucuronyltransferase LARGE2s-like [Saccoglossus kowalevskii]|uniref:Glycosyltransferase-like protein LARGE2-B-like n=1 Tax=Saccoglossus kowalevskii TaxID=10224 RepID=A0ABM0MW89_SACKO|nr:PREDICTED: glycosyltransferase-like protein LARGE2-B-like [Saccoglossus kowalevskii]
MIANRKTISVFTICICLQACILVSFLFVINQNGGVPSDSELDLQRRSIRLIPRQCETLHFLICVPELEAVRSLSVLVKSVIIHRVNPLHFHFVINDLQVNITIHKLFETWRLPQADISIYSPEELVDVLHSDNVPFSKVIVTEVQTVFETDVRVFWNEFFNFESSEVIGLVGTIWDANPYSRGLILINVERLMKKSMLDVLENIIMESKLDPGRHLPPEKSPMKRLWKSFTDDNSRAVRLLPCYWYIETTFRCFDSVSEVLSFNSKTVIEEDGQMGYERRLYFKTALYSLQDLDGNLLRSRNITCNWNGRKPQISPIPIRETTPQKPGRRDPKILCADFYKRETLKLRTHTFFVGNLPEDPPSNDVTLALQTDFYRLIQMFELVASYWTGPISLAVYANDQQAHEVFRFASSSKAMRTRHDIAIHIGYEERDLRQYPFNHMRNIALGEVRTPFIYMSEIDFLYKSTAYEDIRRRLGHIVEKQEDGENQAIVVPAFETEHLNLSYIPKSKNELVRLYTQGKLRFFHSLDFSKGHEATNFTKWMTSVVPYPVTFNLGYEPYLVLSKKGLPEFPLLFSGMGRDKIIYTQMLKVLGYKLSVSPNAYMIHMPHWPSTSKMMWDADGNYRWCVYQLTARFLKKFMNENKLINEEDEYR